MAYTDGINRALKAATAVSTGFRMRLSQSVHVFKGLFVKMDVSDRILGDFEEGHVPRSVVPTCSETL